MGHPHHLDAHRHPISHATQTVSCLHQPNLTSHKSPNFEEEQRQMVVSDSYLSLSSHQDELMHNLFQNSPLYMFLSQLSSRINHSDHMTGNRGAVVIMVHKVMGEVLLFYIINLRIFNHLLH